MRKILLVAILLSSVPLYAGHGSSKPENTKSSLVKTVIELLNSKRKKDTVKKKKKNERRKKKSRNKRTR